MEIIDQEDLRAPEQFRRFSGALRTGVRNLLQFAAALQHALASFNAHLCWKPGSFSESFRKRGGRDRFWIFLADLLNSIQVRQGITSKDAAAQFANGFLCTLHLREGALQRGMKSAEGRALSQERGAVRELFRPFGEQVRRHLQFALRRLNPNAAAFAHDTRKGINEFAAAKPVLLPRKSRPGLLFVKAREPNLRVVPVNQCGFIECRLGFTNRPSPTQASAKPIKADAFSGSSSALRPNRSNARA